MLLTDHYELKIKLVIFLTFSIFMFNFFYQQVQNQGCLELVDTKNSNFYKMYEFVTSYGKDFVVTLNFEQIIIPS